MVNFSVRGGASLKKKWVDVKRQKSAKYACPACGKVNVKRKTFSVWNCRSCGAEFAGGANVPSTLVGKSMNLLLNKESSRE